MSNLKEIDSEISNFVEFLHNGGEIKPFLKDIYLITVYVAGLYYIDGIDEIFPKLKNGDRLELFRENNNKYDSSAIVVKHGKIKIGYVPRDNNTILANLMDAGKELYGIIEDVNEDEIYEGYPSKEVIFKVFLKE